MNFDLEVKKNISFENHKKNVSSTLPFWLVDWSLDKH